jgi:hypothetical protein
VQTNDPAPELTPPRHFREPCDYYGSFNVTGDYLFAVGELQLTVYARVTPDREEVRIVYPFKATRLWDTAIEATEEIVVVAHEDGVLILRWTAIADQAYLPIVHGGASVEPTLSR